MRTQGVVTPAVCGGRPPEWWETGDGGNRLALLLCGACTGCPDNDRRPAGVIRNGAAYNDDGEKLANCACGYPTTISVEQRAKNRRRRNPDYEPVCARCRPIPVAIYRHEILKRIKNRTMTVSEVARWQGVNPTNISRLIKQWTNDAEETNREQSGDLHRNP